MDIEKALLFIGNFYLNENMPIVYRIDLKFFDLKVVDNKTSGSKSLLAYPYDRDGRLVAHYIPRVSELAFNTDLTTLIKVWKILDFKPSFSVDDAGNWTCSCENDFGRGEYVSRSICEAACLGTVRAIEDTRIKIGVKK